MTRKLKPYSLHPSFSHWYAMLTSLEERTGKSMRQWLEALDNANAATAAEARVFLRDQKLGASSIGLILDHRAGKSPDSYNPHAMVDEMFKGAKQNLLPIYEAVLSFVLNMGDEVKACPCATIVPFYRNHVFAQVRPATRTRLDLGLALGKLKASETRGLIDTGGLAKRDRITHRLELVTPADFNDFAKDWLGRAYASDSQ